MCPAPFIVPWLIRFTDHFEMAISECELMKAKLHRQVTPEQGAASQSDFVVPGMYIASCSTLPDAFVFDAKSSGSFNSVPLPNDLGGNDHVPHGFYSALLPMALNDHKASSN